MGFDEPANDRVELSGALDQERRFLGWRGITVDAIRFGPKVILFPGSRRGFIDLIDLVLVGSEQVQDARLPREKETLDHILCRGAERGIYHLEDLASADQIVCVIDVGLVESELGAGIEMVEEEVVLNQDGDAMAKLARRHRRVLSELRYV